MKEKKTFTKSMSYSLFIIYLLININYAQSNPCLFLNSKLHRYGIYINPEEGNFLSMRLCQNLVNNYCCSQTFENKLRNITMIELQQLFDLYLIHLYEPLRRTNIQLNG